MLDKPIWETLRRCAGADGILISRAAVRGARRRATPSASACVTTASTSVPRCSPGGNQQKLAFARWWT